MDFAARGVPIHVRAHQVTLREGGDGLVAFEGSLLDLRKRGFVPVGGDLQPSGIVHQMQVHGAIDPASGTIATIAARMPNVAFEASETTRGESCRDLAGNVEALAGTPLEPGFARRVGEEIGGARGCSHVLTLVHHLGPTAAWALREDARIHGGRPARRHGERLFRRDVVVDGWATDGGELLLALQMGDLHMRPQPADAAAVDRFARQLEVRVEATLSMGEMRLSSVRIAERRRGPADLDSAPWRPRPERAEQVHGLSLRAGITAELLRRFADPGDDRPLLDALLLLAPTTVQCFASFVDTWTQVPWSKNGGTETGGLPDSCWMWRRGGAL
ncbi:MAG: DUF2889 domain-containing protein, partial [Alphaproteobacteria bacterium]